MRERERRETEQMSEIKVSALFGEVILARSQPLTSSKTINTFVSALSLVERRPATDISLYLHGARACAHPKCRTEGTGTVGEGAELSSHY